jgi:hypothetical protein
VEVQKNKSLRAGSKNHPCTIRVNAGVKAISLSDYPIKFPETNSVPPYKNENAIDHDSYHYH